MTAAPLKIFLVDDEKPARERLKAVLADIAGQLPNQVAGEAANGMEALEAIPAAAPDLVLVDIRMPRMDGVELVRHLGRMERPPAVVFVTAYDQYAVQAFELNAVDYLLKPVRAERLAGALEKARRSGPLAAAVLDKLPQEGRRHLSCTERGRILIIPVEHILYLKAELKYVTARTAEREYLLEESLTQLEAEFPQRFVRVHRNCLIAREAIAGFERDAGSQGETHWLALVKGAAEKLPISRRQWPAVKSAFAGEKAD